jgi:basic membrane protein A and related proteins
VKKVLRATAIAGIAALALAACGDAPEEEGSGGGSGSGEATASDFLACMVTDSGGVDDRSFNASAWQGLVEAKDQLGIEAKYVESNSETDFAPNVQQMVADDCGIIVTVGFLLGDATKEAAEANAEEHFAIVDFQYQEPVENIKPLIFDTAQAAFLAGYAAADTTKTGTVATFGGINIPTVSIFMDGFADGVTYYNEQKGKDVKLLGWDKDAQNGSFTGDFQDQNKGKNLANTFIQQGADIIMPVAGPVGLGAAAAAQESTDVKIVGVDSDWYESAPQYKALVLTSVVKEIDTAVLDTTQAASEGDFGADPYVGTLENEGVALAPFHDFESQVRSDLQSELDDLKDKIVSGEVTVESPSSPKA